MQHKCIDSPVMNGPSAPEEDDASAIRPTIMDEQQSRNRDVSGSVRILTTLQELEDIIPAWREVVVHPHTLPEIYMGFVEADDEIAHPLVPIILDPDGSIAGMALARLQTSQLTKAGTYMPMLRPKARVIVIPFDGFMGTRAKECAPALLDALLGYVDAGGADVIECPYLPDDSAMHLELLETCPRYADGMTKNNVHWNIEIAPTYDEQLQGLGKSTRGTLRNNLNRFKREFDGRYEIKRHGADEDLKALMATAEEVAKSSYHAGLGAGFTPSERERSIYSAAHDLGVLWSRVLMIDGRPAAFMHALEWRGVLTGTYMAHSRDFTKLPIGTILLFMALEELCAERRISRWDFGPGDAEYKRRLCTHQHVDQRKTIFARTLKAQRVRLITAAGEKIESGLKATIEKLNLGLRFRTMFRNRIRNKNKTPR